MPLDYSEIVLSIEERERGRLASMKELEVCVPLSEGKWSKKEILGHLIDSASNNHQRFVRAMLAGNLEFPAYLQAEWVRSQEYGDENWTILVNLWSAYNLHLAHVIANVPPDKLSTKCKIGDKDPMTLEELISDYVRHMEHHLKQLNGIEE